LNTHVLVMTVVFTFLPISELRGGIPYALANHMNIFLTYGLTVAVNSLVAPLLFVFFNTFHKLLYKLDFYKRFFDAVVRRTRQKVHKKVEKYGYWGLALFVAVPLPVTGAYTGTIGAWILGMDAKKSFAAITVGVLISGLVVSTISYFGIKTLSFFLG